MRRRDRKDERGAVALFVALLLTVVLLIAALAVDIGMQRVGRSDMQSLADVVALDLARELDGRTVQELTDAGVTTTLAAASRDRNQDVIGYDDRLPTLDVDLGRFESGTFTELGAGAVPSAVRVKADTDVGFVFEGVTGIGSGAASRPAVAQAEGGACFKVGSFALGLATNDSILSGLLGDAAAARVLSYEGIATAGVSLLGLAAELGVGTPSELLTAPNVTVGQLLEASAAVLTDDPETANADLATALLGLKADLGPLAAERVNFLELLDLGQGDGSALDADINVLDLVTGALIIANGENAIAVPEMNLNVLGTTLTAKLHLVQAPRTGCNGGTARTAQGYIELSGTVYITVLGTGLRLPLSVTVSLANATATLDSSKACREDEITLNVGNQTLADVRLIADVWTLLLGAPLLKIAKIDTGAPGTAPPTSWTLPLPESYTDPTTTSSGTIGLDLTDADVTVLGVLNVGALVSALAPLVNGVTALLTSTVLPALGITTAGADLWAVPRRACTRPKLVQ